MQGTGMSFISPRMNGNSPQNPHIIFRNANLFPSSKIIATVIGGEKL
jgi:hypothetical protein